MTLIEALSAGLEHHRAGRFAQAEPYYQAILTEHPEHPDANHYMGMLGVHGGQIEAALPWLAKALRARPESTAFRLAYARALLSIGRARETLTALDAGTARAGVLPAELAVLRARASAMLDQADARGVASVSKVFCIGRNKTGTTSLDAALRALGFRMGEQAQGEVLLEDWAQRRFGKIVELCRSADAFQDIPFSLPYTYQALDQAFPNSKFILSVRSTPEQWFGSVTRFHTGLIGKGRLPNADDLRAYAYRATGWLWRNQELVYGINADTLYDEAIYKAHYLSHNQQVQDYFKYRPADLLVLDLSNGDAMARLCAFLGFSDCAMAMPHLNRSA